MSTLHLVAPEARESVAQFAAFDPNRHSVEDFRAAVLEGAQVETRPVRGQERFVAGPDGAPEVRLLIHRPPGSSAGLPAILAIHGGGYVAGAADLLDAESAGLARASGAVVIAVDYRLAPETPFPGPLEDCYVALAWVFGHANELGIDPARVALLGQSAGGGLAAALALLSRDRGQHILAGQLLIYPMLDPRTGTADAPVDNSTTGEFVWTRAANRFCWDALRGAQPVEPERVGHYAPALANDLSGLPPAFIAVGSLDLFLEEDVAFALRLSRAGVPVDAHVYPGGVHGFEGFPGPLADEFNADMQAAIRRFLRT